LASSESTTAPPASPPVDTAPPTITGIAQVGSSLKASPGSWTGSPASYGYQWKDCTSSSTCTNISGATSSSYTLQSSEDGKTVDVVVTATNAEGSASATSAQTGTVQAAPVPPPIDTTLPTISGTAQVGNALTASTGSWANQPSSYAYQWQDCTSSTSCSNIGGATSSTYTLQSSDAGKTVDVVVTATNAGGSTFVTSAQTPTVPAPASGNLGSGQVFAHWLAWETSVPEADIPWNDVTQIGLDMLTTNTTTSGCSSNCTTLNTSQNSIDRMDLPAWISMIHQHGKLAIIDIGGSTDQDWANACNASNLPGFASELVNWMVSNGFDGVNLDIESLSGSGTQLTLWANCVQAIAQDAHAARTQAGKTPIVAEDVDQSWMDEAVAHVSQWVDQFQLMYYGYPVSETAYDCANGTPVNTCAQVNTFVQNLHNTADIPYSKMLLGMSAGGGEAQCCYLNLATTSASVNSGGSVSSIQLSSGLSAALPAGEVVLASTENPPTHWEMFTTSGAAQGAKSIPITGGLSGSGSYTFPSGSDIQSAYEGPWDCGNFGRYARSAGLGGLMIWTLQQDAGGHGGQFPCFDQGALGLGL
jgi:Glycosyl hydrolases family 18